MVSPYFMASALSRYINEQLSFKVEYERIFGHSMPSGNVLCCFHANTDTPAARLYGNRLHCYACMRSYSVYDLLWKYDRGRIKELLRSGVIPEVSVFEQQAPAARPELTFKSIGAMPAGMVRGSFEFYSWLSSD